MAIVHTEVPPAVAGRGIAGELVRSALEFARAQGWKVRPLCSYAVAAEIQTTFRARSIRRGRLSELPKKAA